MSQSSLFAFLLQLDAEMEKSSKEYREEKANKRTHPFNFDKNELVKHTIHELESRSYTITAEDRAVMVSASNTMLTELKQTMKPFSKMKEARYTETATGVSMIFTSIVGVESKYHGPENVFEKVKATYRPALRNYFDAFQEHFKSTK